MTDYTPTTEQVERAYVTGMRQAFIASEGEHRAEFDRWFRAELARAWDESEDAWVDFYENPALPTPENPYRKATGDE